MGSSIELNDTLQLTTQQGFPAEILNIETHQKTPITLESIQNKTFSFHGKLGVRMFHLEPTRVYYAHKIDDKWLFWGKIFIEKQIIEKQLDKDGNWTGEWVTSGTYKIAEIYSPEYQKSFTLNETPKGLSYF